jgi:hypothetical protein
VTKRPLARAAVVALAMSFSVASGCGSEKDPADTPNGCPGPPVNVAEPNSIASASFNQVCDGATSLVTWSDRAAGSPCTDARQCKPTCCYCTTDGASALTSWCDHGRCATPMEVCCATAGTPLKSCGH